MPVRKFRDVSEMEDTWREPGDPALFRAIESVWDFAERTCPMRFPPGVYKHRSIEDAQALVEVWAEQNFRAFQERRRIEAERSASAPLPPPPTPGS
ncbi:MAG: hypothetical protein ABIT01_20500 [Thermoanaerobaculia bacterium]